jgi:hypothetical protein
VRLRHLDLKGNGFQNVIIRCKEITLNEAGRAKIQDATVLYGLSGGQFKPQRITDPSDALGLTAKVCKPTVKSWLCRLPGYMTETSGQNEALDSMFPKARAASRDFAHFRSLKRTMSMTDVVRQCGVPDELGVVASPFLSIILTMARSWLSAQQTRLAHSFTQTISRPVVNRRHYLLQNEMNDPGVLRQVVVNA